MKRIFLIVAMTFITSIASAQITSEQFNQINFKVSQQTMIEQLQSYGFTQNNSGALIGQVSNQNVEITFTLSENGMIDRMNVKELNQLDASQLNQRVAELREMIAEQNKPISLSKEQDSQGKFLITLIYE
jgi:hypothetical protein